MISSTITLNNRQFSLVGEPEARTCSINTTIGYTRYSVHMTWGDFINFEDNPLQPEDRKNHIFENNNAEKGIPRKHLSGVMAEGLEESVYAIIMADGRTFKLDGHSRALAVSRGQFTYVNQETPLVIKVIDASSLIEGMSRELNEHLFNGFNSEAGKMSRTSKNEVVLLKSNFGQNHNIQSSLVMSVGPQVLKYICINANPKIKTNTPKQQVIDKFASEFASLDSLGLEYERNSKLKSAAVVSSIILSMNTLGVDLVSDVVRGIFGISEGVNNQSLYQAGDQLCNKISREYMTGNEDQSRETVKSLLTDFRIIAATVNQ